MALAADLMGLGLSPLIASRTATAGIGPVTIVAAGGSFTSATKIQATQFLVSNSTGGGLGVALPTVGGDAGAFLGDDFIINNAATASLNVFCSSGVTISVGGANTSSTSLSSHVTLTCYPITTTQWVGVRGS
jgi:hypothetical protein